LSNNCPSNSLSCLATCCLTWASLLRRHDWHHRLTATRLPAAQLMLSDFISAAQLSPFPSFPRLSSPFLTCLRTNGVLTLCVFGLNTPRASGVDNGPGETFFSWGKEKILSKAYFMGSIKMFALIFQNSILLQICLAIDVPTFIKRRRAYCS